MRPRSMQPCPRCRGVIGCPETCWYCAGDMCLTCWEGYGHCGHPEADAITAAARGMTDAQRRAIGRALTPAAADSVLRPKPLTN